MICAFFFSCVLAVSPITASSEQKSMQGALCNETNEDATLALDNLLTPCAIITICALIASTTVKGQKHIFFDQITPYNLALNFLQEYSKNWIATIAHEYGHNMAQYALNGNWGAMHVGASKKIKQSYIKFGKLHVDGLNPLHGSTERLLIDPQTKKCAVSAFIEKYCKDKGVDIAQISITDVDIILKSHEFAELQKSLIPNRLHLAIFLLAGGIMGSLSNHLTKAITDHNFYPDGITFYHLMNAFVPFDEESDATVLFRDCLGVTKPTNNLIIACSPLIEMCTEIVSVLLDSRTSNDTLVFHKILIGLLNYFTRGYLRFHA